VKPLRTAAVAASLAVALAGCGSTSHSTSKKPEAKPTAGGGKTLTVLAAASLTGTFRELGGEFEKAHPGVKVRFSFLGSSTLAQQIVQGAPADVFASADQATMAVVTKANDASGTPTVFVRNRLEIAVPPANKAGVRGLRDLGRSGTKVVLCAVQVPCGAAAVKVLAQAGVKVRPVSLEADVKAALTKVELDEADAALVYRTDVQAAGGKVRGIDFPESAKVVNSYPIVALSHAPQAALAGQFVQFVLSAQGKAVLTRAGFESP
jgi:molybdate transport system substrate-binding protein